MRPAICTAILFLISIGFLVLHELFMAPWRPMFVLILLSFAVSLVVAFLAFRRSAAQARTVGQAIIFSCITVFLSSTVLSLVWAVSEEGLIHYYLATYGRDENEGRYFYPGNSGMGYAEGLSRPADLIFWTLVRGISLAAIIGVPLGFIIAPRKTDSEQDGGGRSSRGLSC